MRHLLPFLLLTAAFGQTTTITDTIRTPFGGLFSGTVTVTLNGPGQAQPLYSGNVTLSGWSQTVNVAAGAFTLTLYANDQITPNGTSYTATFAPASGTGWKETWVVATGATTIRAVRATTVPVPAVKFGLAQLDRGGANVGQGLVWGGSSWGPSSLLVDPTTTSGDLIYRGPSSLLRLGAGAPGQVLTVSGGAPAWTTLTTSGSVTNVSVVSANGVSGTVANPTTTPAIALSLGAITPTSVAATGTVSGSNLSGTNTGDQTNITGNAGTATALAANGTNCAAGSFPLGVDASGNAESCTAAVTASTGLSDSAALVRNNQANTYTAGSKQTFASNATTAGAAFGGGITADPSSVSAGDFWYRADLGTFGFRNATAVDALVAGGRALTTPGSVPFVTAAGVLGQSGNLFWDNANVRLGIGRNNPSTVLHVEAANPAFTLTRTGISNLTIANGGSGVWSYTANGGQGFSFGITGGAEWARLAPTTGNLLLGTTTDDGTNRLQVAGNIRLAAAGSREILMRDTNGSVEMQLLADTASLNIGVKNVTNLWAINSSGTNTLYNATPTTGTTSLVVRAGAGQTGNLTTWQNSGGSAIASISSGGDILARIHTWANGTEGTCDATLRGQVVMVQGGAGVADRLRLCRKDATDTYLWAPVDNNVALQVVSSGPTATVTNQVRRVYVDPATVIASLTLTLPAAPLDADQVQVFFGGTIANQAAVVTTLTISPNSGQAISQYSAPANAFGGDMVTYEYRAAAARWYRIQ